MSDASPPPSSLRSRVRTWTVLLMRFISGEIVVQGIGFLIGIFLFHHFSKADAAFYNLANSMLGMMTLLSDNGVGAGIYAIGGKVWRDRNRFGELIATAFHIRRRLNILTMAAVSPLTWYLLRHNGCPPWQTFEITCVVIIGTYFQILTSILGEIPKLHLQAIRLQKLNIGIALLRLGLIGAALLTRLSTLTALLANLGGSIVQAQYLRRWMPPLADPDAPVNVEDKKVLISLIKRQLPSSIYYCIYGQITIFLISLTGNVSNLADVAALSALARVFAVIGSVMSTIIYPRFAHIQEPYLLWRRYLQIIGLFLLMGAVMCGLTWLFPRELLWILGNKYQHLQNEVLLMVAGSVLGVIGGNLWSLNSARGWIVAPWLYIPASILTQALLIWLLPVSTVGGVLWMGLLGNIPGIAINFALAHRRVGEMKNAAAHPLPNIAI
ncbi:MAG: hypothetical protein ABIT76_04765 [Chthoniobacterales bacterium]